MRLWLKGQRFLQLLERKQQVVIGHIASAENQRSQTDLLIKQKQQECAEVKQKIQQLTPAGIQSRGDVYKKIRHQGLLLNRLQLLVDEITRLDNERNALQKQLQQLQVARIALDKKQHKISFHLKRVRREYLSRNDMDAENEIQEMLNNDTGYF